MQKEKLFNIKKRPVERNSRPKKRCTHTGQTINARGQLKTYGISAPSVKE